MTDQPRIPLNDGSEMPQLGFGVFLVPPEETRRLVKDAIDLGYQAIDTATFYRNEAEVGQGIRDSGQNPFVTTKLWNEHQGYDNALRHFDASYKALGLDVIDLYLIHWPKPALGLFVETWKALIRLRDEGRVRSIGVSNFTMAHLETIIHDTGVVPVVNQIELHPHFQQVELRAFHDENDIVTTSWSPLGRGGVGSDLSDPKIAEIARKHGRTPAQVIRSPLATMAVRRGRRWMGMPDWCTAAADIKLWVLPESSSATRETEPRVTAICMVSPGATPATAWREKQGASVSAAPVSASASSISTPSKKKMRLQKRLWPREYFSLQLKHRPWRRRSAISSGDKRLEPSPRPVAAPSGGAGSAKGACGAGSA